MHTFDFVYIYVHTHTNIVENTIKTTFFVHFLIKNNLSNICYPLFIIYVIDILINIVMIYDIIWYNAKLEC